MGFATRLNATSTHRHDVHTCSSDACSGASAIRHTSSTARTSRTKQTRQAAVLRVLLAAPPACVLRPSLRTPSPLLARPLPTLTLQPRAPAHRSAVQPAAVAQTPIAAVRIEQFPDVLRSLTRRVVLKNTGCCGHHGCKAASCMAFCTARAAWRTALAAAQTAAPSSAVK